MKKYKDDKFETLYGTFTIEYREHGSKDLIQNGISCIAGYNLNEKILYVGSYVDSCNKYSIIDSFIRAINEGRL